MIVKTLYSFIEWLAKLGIVLLVSFITLVLIALFDASCLLDVIGE